MTFEEAHLISVSYKIGDRSKYHTCDTIRALDWALEQIKPMSRIPTGADYHILRAKSEFQDVINQHNMPSQIQKLANGLLELVRALELIQREREEEKAKR